MSMLAERKSKQKWSLNPRGKAWSDDSSKFGQKMLEKMGWSKGKGLGANENGITEHVKISYKNDSKGMGFKESNDQWTEHDANFNALLSSLSNSETTPIDSLKIKSSLEQKSQNSRARVHYKKFTRGKDLSRCSEKDLANIFGKKSLKPQKIEKETIQNEEKTEEIKDSFSYNGGSMLDYFKSKLPNFTTKSMNGFVVGSNGVLKKVKEDDKNNEDEEELPVYAGFGFSTSNKRKSTDDNNFTPKKMKMAERNDSPWKKMKSEIQEDVAGQTNPAFEPMFNNISVEKHVLNPILEETREENESFEVIKKKKKKNLLGNEEIIKNNGFEVENTNQSFEYEETNSFEVKKKKKLKKKNVESDNNGENGVTNINFMENGDLECEDTKINSFEVKRKKKSKKKNGDFGHTEDLQVQNGVDNINFSQNDNLETEETSFNQFEVKRKKKTKKKNINIANGESFEVTNGIDNVNFSQNDDFDEEQTSFNDFEVKRKKKMKKEKSEDETREDLNIKNGIDNINFTENDDQISVNNFEVKRKKKTKKKNEENDISVNFEVQNGFDNVTFNQNDSLEAEKTVLNSFEVKRKKKTKKKNEENNISLNFEVQNGFDNVTFNQNDSLKSETTVLNSFEVKRIKKKMKKTDEIEANSESFEIKRKKKSKKLLENGITNTTFDLTENSIQEEEEETSKNFEYEVKRKKKSKTTNLAIDNPNFDIKNDVVKDPCENFEVKRQKKKKMCEAPNFLEPNQNKLDSTTVPIEEPSFDLMLNVISTPQLPKPIQNTQTSTAKRRKSVRFSNVNQEHIIPNNEMRERNELFDINTKVIENGLRMEENCNAISKKIDGFQAEIENDLNEAKDFVIGDVSNPNGDNEILQDGSTKLKFKFAKFGRSPNWMMNKKDVSYSKSGYKHLIKGDIIVGFKNTNLHEIEGYASQASPNKTL